MQHPALRNALALKRTLEKQRIRIEPDELARAQALLTSLGLLIDPAL